MQKLKKDDEHKKKEFEIEKCKRLRLTNYIIISAYINVFTFLC